MIFSNKVDQKTFLVKLLGLAGRYGKFALVALLAVAYVAACIKAFAIVRIAIALMLPVAALVGVYIAVMEEDKE